MVFLYWECINVPHGPYKSTLNHLVIPTLKKIFAELKLYAKHWIYTENKAMNT